MLKRLQIVITVLAFAALAHSPLAAKTPSLDALAWLEGDWLRETPRGDVVETWERVSENTMEGHASLSSEGETRVGEHMRLVRMGQDVFYIAKPTENPLPVAFKLIEFTETRFVFENTTHDFPHRIIYNRVGDSDLLVRIEGPGEGEKAGETQAVEFRFERW